MAGLNWRLHPNGDVALCPVGGWEIALMAEVAIGLQLQFFRTPEDMLRGTHAVEQLVLTPAQARLLAEDLLRKATQAEAPAAPGAPRN
ncbi:MAG TPA: hypothetical protein VL358_04765 [Caulobacteraceae bacterium]|jgi:hypothetical protein|nr:hypothetical protein [Caulobacteraceae bacterium]